MYFALACFAALLFVYSLISEKVERLSLSGPIVFVAVGVALGASTGCGPPRVLLLGSAC